jgi:hypothetical protein
MGSLTARTAHATYLDDSFQVQNPSKTFVKTGYKPIIYARLHFLLATSI